MWSEWIPSLADMERQVFPRLAAYAEVGWTQAKVKDYERFSVSLERMKDGWRSNGINFYEDKNY